MDMYTLVVKSCRFAVAPGSRSSRLRSIWGPVPSFDQRVIYVYFSVATQVDEQSAAAKDTSHSVSVREGKPSWPLSIRSRFQAVVLRRELIRTSSKEHKNALE